MIGGFLGAGKTTAVARLARHLSERGLRIGLITNDQGQNLVDTAMLRSQGYATEEIAGGCFCCRFNSLMEAAHKLTRENRPDIFIAEPVGSCTDLVATVTYPLRRLYGDEFTIAPVSVLVDPIRARRIFGLDKGSSFSEKVLYIYKKQIEEADLAVISKCDLLDEAQLAGLRAALQNAWPGKEILSISARTGANLEPWFARLTGNEQSTRQAMDVDYAVYADGEASLGWLNCAAGISADAPFDGNEFLQCLAREIQQRLLEQQAEIAHLKMTLTPEAGLSELAVVNLVRNDFVPELGMQLEEPLAEGQLMINLRAEAPPPLLESAVREGLTATAATFAAAWKLHDLEHFRPGKPVPTHRLVQP